MVLLVENPNRTMLLTKHMFMIYCYWSK